MGCVYYFKNKINGKGYVGKTLKSFHERLIAHIWDSKFRIKNIFNKALNKYGIENFTQEILKESDDNEVLIDFEKFYIKEKNTKIPNGYNMTDGGEGTSGWKMSEETKKKIGKSNKGKKGQVAWNKGRKMSDDFKKKCSESHKGQVAWNKGLKKNITV